MSLSAIERETVIIFNDGEDTATVTSSQPTVWTRMARRNVKPDREERLAGRVVTKVYTVPKSWIKIQPNRQVGDAQKQAASERMRALREAGQLAR